MTEQIDDFTMPSNEADRKKIKELLYEMSGALQAIADKRSFMKDTAEAMEKNYSLPKKVAMKMARTIHKDNYSAVSAESERFSIAFETLFTTEGED